MKPDSITLLDASGVSLSEEVSIRQRGMKRSVKATWGRFLEDLGPWDYFLTQTFRWRCGYTVVEDYIKRLFKVAGPRRVFMVAERPRGSLGPHIHGLIGETSVGISEGEIAAFKKQSWGRWGRCQMEEFVPELGAAHYVSKEMAGSDYSPIYTWGLGAKPMSREEIEETLEKDGPTAFRM